ncbi:MAG: hypothetical protein IT344_05605 [Candidatus Dadabacteria bacterium]|nr:hypothetical protein [Candidatus Dadabacteria bacterium]
MAMSVLMVYEPLGSARDQDYWRSYIKFYEQFRDGPATPQSVWYGREYETFRESFSAETGVAGDAIRDCFFFRDEDGEYYLTPVGRKANVNMFTAEDFIPLEWFLMYRGEEKKYFYTHSGWGAVSRDAIYYRTRLRDAALRLEEAGRDIEAWTASGPGPVSSIVEGLAAGAGSLRHWLSSFDENGFVLLNYGEISTRIAPGSLRNEDSVSELGNALLLARENDPGRAGTALMALVAKWDSINSALTGAAEKKSSTLQ